MHLFSQTIVIIKYNNDNCRIVFYKWLKIRDKNKSLKNDGDTVSFWWIDSNYRLGFIECIACNK